MRFQRVPGQIADEVPAGSGDSGANSRQRSGGFRGRKLMRSRGFWCRWLMRFQEVPGQMAKILPRSSKLLGRTHESISKILRKPAGRLGKVVFRERSEYRGCGGGSLTRWPENPP